MALAETRTVKQRHMSALLGKKNVVACGVGRRQVGGVMTDELSIVVSVVTKLPEDQLAAGDLVPQTVEGVRTDVQETGVIRVLQARTDKWRPAPGGVSCGHYRITAGTLGCLVTKGEQIYILSNNHVLANSNDAQLGDPILQPGPHDGGTNQDQIATLADFVPINFGTAESTCSIASGTAAVLNGIASLVGSSHRLSAFQQDPAINLVDAAIAEPASADLVEKRILEIGEPQGIGEGVLGLPIRKSGRTTGLTSGEVTQVDVTARVSYGAGKVVTFSDQLMAGGMSSGGDSGSAVLDENNRVVGLLFAGSETTTVINRIQNVLTALDVSLLL
jgi:hypothetical protein